VTALSQGDAAVFVVLLSGKRDADDAVLDLLRRELPRLERLVKLPEQNRDGPRIRLGLPLKVSFTVLPLGRDEPGEDGLLRLLLASEANLHRVSGPIVMPVFGRGRLLGSLFGDDLQPDNVFEVVSFLCGECSCEVKELNPGVDLLIAADWPAIFERIGPAPASGPDRPAGLTRHAGRAKPIAGLLPIAPGAAKDDGVAIQVVLSHYAPDGDRQPASSRVPVEPSPHRFWLWWATVAAALLVIATGAWAALHARRRASPP